MGRYLCRTTIKSKRTFLNGLKQTGGYKKKEQLRGTDDIIRRGTFRVLQEASSYLRESYRMAVRYSLMEEAREIESLYLLCDLLAQSILHAPRGYKPVGGTTSVKEDDLNKLLEFDASLTDIVETIKEKTGEVRTAILQKDVDGLGSAISTLRVKLNELETLMKRRDALLDGIM
ncbi:hypothetical protein [Thermococcus sp.]|uniref:hypothetical protein n=1 Tax=Thermococcus sp. TaxID=35749 RepID=UPI0026142977|nr:hypothetical protein [Thermococcus sp.]